MAAGRVHAQVPGFCQFAIAVPILFLVASLGGCSSSSPIHPVTFPVPATITISPAPMDERKWGRHAQERYGLISSHEAAMPIPWYPSQLPSILVVVRSTLPSLTEK